MLAFMVIFAASIAGYAGLPPWVIAATAIALSSISYVEHRRAYDRARDFGLSGVLDAAVLRSVLNGTLAGLAAYGFGALMRLI